MRAILALAPLLLLTGCTDPEGARNVLDAAGYSHIQIVPRSNWLVSSCGDGDSYATHFTANGPTGIPVEGVVCSQGSWGKGATIRITKVHRRFDGPAAPQSGAAR